MNGSRSYPGVHVSNSRPRFSFFFSCKRGSIPYSRTVPRECAATFGCCCNTHHTHPHICNIYNPYTHYMFWFSESSSARERVPFPCTSFAHHLRTPKQRMLSAGCAGSAVSQSGDFLIRIYPKTTNSENGKQQQQRTAVIIINKKKERNTEPTVRVYVLCDEK